MLKFLRNWIKKKTREWTVLEQVSGASRECKAHLPGHIRTQDPPLIWYMAHLGQRLKKPKIFFHLKFRQQIIKSYSKQVAEQQFEQHIISNFDNNCEIFRIKCNCPNKCLYGLKFIPTDWLDTKLIEQFVHSKPSNCKGRMGSDVEVAGPPTPTNQILVQMKTKQRQIKPRCRSIGLFYMVNMETLSNFCKCRD